MLFPQFPDEFSFTICYISGVPPKPFFPRSASIEIFVQVSQSSGSLMGLQTTVIDE